MVEEREDGRGRKEESKESLVLLVNRENIY